MSHSSPLVSSITGGVTEAVAKPIIGTLSAGGGLGPDLVINGGFDTDTNWDKGPGWNISGGTANNTGWGPATNLNSTLPLEVVVGSEYEVTFTISNYITGTIKIFVGSGDTTGVLRSANGTYTETHTAAENRILYIQANSNFQGSIDDISVKAIL